MHRRDVLLLVVVALLLEPHTVQASVIIKTAPHANVKMEFGAQHVPPKDKAVMEESAKVDGTTHLGIEVPHSHNHRNILIHKIGTYLTVVMKALAKTVAPTQDQDGKTHFDIHVDADLGDKDKRDEGSQVTIVHSKKDESVHQSNGDCVKAVVVVSESETNDKKEGHKSSEKVEGEFKSKEVIWPHSHEDLKHGHSHSKQEHPPCWEGKIQVLRDKQEEKKDEHNSKEDSKVIIWQLSKENTKHGHSDSKEESKHWDAKIHISNDKKEEKKDEYSSKEDSQLSWQLSKENTKHGHSDSKEENKQWEAKIHISNDKKEEKKHKNENRSKEETKLLLNLSAEDAKHQHSNSKEEKSKQWEEKLQVLKEKLEENKDELLKFEPPKDWESFKKTQAMLKDKGFILQLDKSFYMSKENQGKQSHKVQSFDVNKDIKFTHGGKSLSGEEMDEFERNLKSLEHSESASGGTWASAGNPVSSGNKYQSSLQVSEKSVESGPFSKSETIHMSRIDYPSNESNQLQAVKTTEYHSADGPVVSKTVNSIGEMPSSNAKAVNYEVLKQTSDKLNPAKTEQDRQVSLATNEIPSVVSTRHFQQTSYSSDRSRAMTLVAQNQAFDSGRGVLAQSLVHQKQDKVSENSRIVPHSVVKTKSPGDSREVIMHLAPLSKSGASKKAHLVDVKKVLENKQELLEEGNKGESDSESITRQDSIRKLPMANIPTLIGVLQKSPPQEVERLTHLATNGTSKESSEEPHFTESDKMSDASSPKAAREFFLTTPNGGEDKSEKRKEYIRSSNHAIMPTTVDDSASKITREEKSQKETDKQDVLSEIAEELLSKLMNEEPKDKSKEKLDNKEDGGAGHASSAEEPEHSKDSPKTVSSSKLEEDLDLNLEVKAQQMNLVEEPGNKKEEKEHVKESENDVKKQQKELLHEPEPGGKSQQQELVDEPDDKRQQKEFVNEPETDDKKQQKELVEEPCDKEQEDKLVEESDVKSQQEEIVEEPIKDDHGYTTQQNAEDVVDYEGQRNEKTFRYAVENEQEEQTHSSPLAQPQTIDVTEYNAHRSHSHSLCSLTTSAEHARSLDIASPKEETQKDETEEEITFLENSKEPDGDKDLEEKGLEKNQPMLIKEAEPHKSSTSSEITGEHYQSVSPTDTDYIDEPSPITEPPTAPSLPEKESINLPAHKERELLYNDDADALVSNLVEVNEEIPSVYVDRDDRASSPDSNIKLLLPHPNAITLPEKSTPPNHAVPDLISPYIYSYYPSFYPKGDHNGQNDTQESQGLYGRPSPRVICVNTDTGKVLGETPNVGDQKNVVAKYSPEETKNHSEDDKLMLLKKLHEDIQKLKQQLNIQ